MVDSLPLTVHWGGGWNSTAPELRAMYCCQINPLCEVSPCPSEVATSTNQLRKSGDGLLHAKGWGSKGSFPYSRPRDKFLFARMSRTSGGLHRFFEKKKKRG